MTSELALRITSSWSILQLRNMLPDPSPAESLVCCKIALCRAILMNRIGQPIHAHDQLGAMETL